METNNENWDESVRLIVMLLVVLVYILEQTLILCVWVYFKLVKPLWQQLVADHRSALNVDYFIELE